MRADLERLKRDSSSGRIATFNPDSGAAAAAAIGSASSHSVAIPPPAEKSSWGRKLLIPAAIVVLILVVAGALLYRNGFFRSGMAATAFQNPSISSLTSSGDVIIARISPDSRYLAYISTQRGQFSLWVRQIATASAVQIVPASTNVIIDAVFSPDGNFLDYSMSAIEDPHAKLYQVPVLGGTPRRILDNVQYSATFSPDGKRSHTPRATSTTMTSTL